MSQQPAVEPMSQQPAVEPMSQQPEPAVEPMNQQPAVEPMSQQLAVEPMSQSEAVEDPADGIDEMDEPSLEDPASQMPPPAPRPIHNHRQSHAATLAPPLAAAAEAMEMGPCTQAGPVSDGDDDGGEADSGAHDDYMPLTQPPLTQAPMAEAQLSPVDGNLPMPARPGAKRSRTQPSHPQAGVLTQQEESSASGVAEVRGPEPSAGDEWPITCPRCDRRCGDVHVALSRPLQYCAPGETPPDLLGLFTLDVVDLWRGEGGEAVVELCQRRLGEREE